MQDTIVRIVRCRHIVFWFTKNPLFWFKYLAKMRRASAMKADEITINADSVMYKPKTAFRVILLTWPLFMLCTLAQDRAIPRAEQATILTQSPT